MDKDDLKFSKGDVIVYKETGDEFRVVGVERAWIYIDIYGFNYLLLDRYYRIFSYRYDFVEKAFEEMVAVEREEYDFDFDFVTTLIEYSI